MIAFMLTTISTVKVEWYVKESVTHCFATFGRFYVVVTAQSFYYFSINKATILTRRHKSFMQHVTVQNSGGKKANMMYFSVH